MNEAQHGSRLTTEMSAGSWVRVARSRNTSQPERCATPRCVRCCWSSGRLGALQLVRGCLTMRSSAPAVPRLSRRALPHSLCPSTDEGPEDVFYAEEALSFARREEAEISDLEGAFIQVLSSTGTPGSALGTQHHTTEAVFRPQMAFFFLFHPEGARAGGAGRGCRSRCCRYKAEQRGVGSGRAEHAEAPQCCARGCTQLTVLPMATNHHQPHVSVLP